MERVHVWCQDNDIIAHINSFIVKVALYYNGLNIIYLNGVFIYLINILWNIFIHCLFYCCPSFSSPSMRRFMGLIQSEQFLLSPSICIIFKCIIFHTLRSLDAYKERGMYAGIISWHFISVCTHLFILTLPDIWFTSISHRHRDAVVRRGLFIGLTWSHRFQNQV